MPKNTLLQTSFASGVLDPRLAARSDIKPFYEGMSVGTNILCLPQGGIKRRQGMAYIDDIGENAILAEFAFNVTQTYLIVFTADAIDVYKDGVNQISIISPYGASDLADLRWTQSADTMIIVHEDYEPRRLSRGATDDAWNLGVLEFTNIPTLSFYDALAAAPTDEVQSIAFSGGWTGGETFQLQLEGNITGVITYSVTTATTEANIQNALRALSNTSATGITVAHNAGTTYHVTFGGDEGGIDWDLMIYSGTISAAVIANVTEGTSAAEDVWSTVRGWPKTVAFFESRLVFGGSSHLPQSVWLSKTNDFFNFDQGTALDDEAIFITLDTDQVNAINGIQPGRHLQIFTTGGEFYISATPITPATAGVYRQSQHGSGGLTPVSIDGSTLFLDRSGKTLRDFVFTYEEEAYNANPLSVLAPQLINAPVDLAAVKSVSGDEANYVYIVNGDGTMAILNTLRSEGILAWSKWETAGNILNVAVIVDDVYFLVERTINSVTKYYLEKADADTYTDSNIKATQASSTTVTGLSHLDDELCRVKADGAVMASNTPSGGSITVERAVEDVEVGLNFDPLVTTMPLNVNYQEGPNLAKDKRVGKVQVDMFESLGLYVDDILLPSRNFGESMLDTTPEPYTGLKETHLLGWSELATVTISQQDPLPMTILALAIEVEG